MLHQLLSFSRHLNTIRR